MIRTFIIAILIALGPAAPALACAWDYDTLHEERSRFPSVLELIVGHYPQHSDEFYEWRIADREAKLARLDAGDPATLPLRDDLAVAHDKLGHPERGIELMRASLEVEPNRYETHANLGTFYIHSGEYERGLAHIKRAIEINPDAHFGREIVQQRLVEYVLHRRGEDGTLTLPLCRSEQVTTRAGKTFESIETFDHFLRQIDPRDSLTYEEKVQGLAGMLRFGRHGSPILLEALGDVLTSNAEGPFDARHLGRRAYLAASYAVEDKEVAEAYRKLAGATPELDEELKAEMTEAAIFVTKLHADERRWIAEGVDVEAAFDAKYRDGGANAALASSWGWEDVKPSPIMQAIWIAVAALILVLVVLAVGGWFLVRWGVRRLRRRSDGDSHLTPLHQTVA